MNISELRESRVDLLMHVSEQLEREKTKWIDLLVEIEPYRTAEDEIERTIRALANYRKELQQLENSTPIGSYRILLPFNNPVYSFVLYSCGIAVAGNHVIVRPSKMTEKYVSLFYRHFPEFKQMGIDFYTGSGKGFIQDACTQDIPGGLLFTGTYSNLQDIKDSLPANQNLIYCGSGICPVVVFSTCNDLKRTVEIIIESKLYNSGQDCLCPEKIIIHDSIFEEFKSCLVEKLKEVKLGETGDINADIYPPIEGLNDEISDRYEQIKSESKLIYEKRDKGCFLSVFECDIDSYSISREKFAPIFTLAKFHDLPDLNALVTSEYKFGIILLGCADKTLFMDFPHIAMDKTVMNIEAQDAHVPFGGKGRSGFSIKDGTYHDGPILYSCETVKFNQ